MLFQEEEEVVEEEVVEEEVVEEEDVEEEDEEEVVGVDGEEAPGLCGVEGQVPLWAGLEGEVLLEEVALSSPSQPC